MNIKESSTIIYTLTDEAPALATASLFPILRAFTVPAGIDMELRDISLAGRILGAFPECLTADQRVGDQLKELGRLVNTPWANIVKLPNISASLPQLKAAIGELQKKGFALPDYPDAPTGDADMDVRRRYDGVKGSAVNPVLREGNSDRRAPRSVKAFAQKNPHHMGKWSADSKSHVASMDADDFFGTETASTVTDATDYRIEFVSDTKETTVLKDWAPLEAGEIIDTAVMRMSSLKAFFAREIQAAKDENVLFSLHLKATMMKVSDPLIFGACVEVYFESVFREYRELFARIGVDSSNGIGDLLARIEGHPKQADVEAALKRVVENRPPLAMVDSDRGITNLHVPSDVIVDASMPAMIRSSGKMWNGQGALQDTKAVIPDRCYAGVYQAVIDYCREHGAFDPATMGSVSNVGLMAQKAEEYGSHDKTFQLRAAGTVTVVNATGEVLLRQTVADGDIFRMCQVKDAAVRDWVNLAVSRAKQSQTPAVFWLNANRPHDGELIRKVSDSLSKLDTEGVEISIMPPVEAALYSMKRLTRGLDTISVTGNVLRDYLTDLFPILEVGTSAKMLSIVPLMKGGGLFETGAGGSAPKHVQQLLKEDYLRWDSLGEFLAMTASLEHVATTTGNPRARILGVTLDAAVKQLLENGKSPARRLGELDNRGSHFYLALYWAQTVASQREDSELRSRFAPLAESLAREEQTIVAQLNGVQGTPVDIGGYYLPDEKRVTACMRPSAVFNELIAAL